MTPSLGTSDLVAGPFPKKTCLNHQRRNDRKVRIKVLKKWNWQLNPSIAVRTPCASFGAIFTVWPIVFLYMIIDYVICGNQILILWKSSLQLAATVKSNAVSYVICFCLCICTSVLVCVCVYVWICLCFSLCNCAFSILMEVKRPLIMYFCISLKCSS